MRNPPADPTGPGPAAPIQRILLVVGMIKAALLFHCEQSDHSVSYKTGDEFFLFHFAESFRTRYSFQSVPAPGSSRLFPEHAPQWSALPSDLGQDSSEAIATLLVFIDDLFAQP
jgi:hypothetical protein